MLKTMGRFSIALLVICGVGVLSALGVGAATENDVLAYASGDTGFQGGGRVHLTDISHDVTLTLLDMTDARHLSWSPDGRHLYMQVSSGGGRLMRMDVSIREFEILTVTARIECYALSPDGAQVAMVAFGIPNELLILDLANGERARPYRFFPREYTEPGCPMAWREDGIVFRSFQRESESSVFLVYDLATGDFAERSYPFESIPVQGDGFAFAISDTRGNRLENGIYRIAPDGTSAPLTEANQLYYSLALSANGEWLAYNTIGANLSEYIEIMHLASGERTFFRERSVFPAWRP